MKVSVPTTYLVMPDVLNSLGLKITYDGEYNAIDSDGTHLASFDTFTEAVEHLQEMYEDLLDSEAE